MLRDPLCQVRRLAINERAYSAVEGCRVTTARFVCECSRRTCDETIELEVSEYEAVRRDASRFFVSPSEAHVFPPLETIVHAGGRFFVVERAPAPAHN